jgi:hypothetical protein
VYLLLKRRVVFSYLNSVSIPSFVARCSIDMWISAKRNRFRGGFFVAERQAAA